MPRFSWTPFCRAIAAVYVLISSVSALAQATSTSAAPSNELVLHKWSGNVNIPDPVACTVDPQGRVYVSTTTRRKVGDLDIREHTMWIPNDVAFDSVEAKQAFLRDRLAPGKMRAPRGGLADHNKDGSIDWKDLTHHSEVIYQVRDTDGDGTADKITVFADGFNTEVTGIAAGVMYHDGWVYATIAPDLWRLKDTNDDGVADIREKVASGFGLHIAYAGHDMHGLSVGPDGRIYWSIGDKGMNVTSREGRNFYYPNEGGVMRVDPDGSNFEVYAHGLRNVQEPAFNDFGDLIGVDNDADQPGERERFVHIIEGSDSGWRCNFQYMRTDSPWMRERLWEPHFPGQAAHMLPPLASYSDGPAGFRFEPGTALSEDQRGMFILNEFPSGKMRAFRAARDGATFKMVDARVLHEGVMGIGLSWHPDGSLMMADWIGGYPLDAIGAIWRVDAKDGAQNAVRVAAHRLLTKDLTHTAENELTGMLGHADQRVRLHGQFELAKRGAKSAFLAVARRATPSSDLLPNPQTQQGRPAQLARIHALWGYGQLLRRGSAEAAEVIALLADPDSEIRAQTAKILGDAVAAAKPHARALVPLLSDAEPRARLQAAIALGKLQLREPAALEAIFTLAARDGAVPALRHAAAVALAGCATAEQLAAKKSDPSPAVRLISVVALRQQAAPAVAAFLADADPLIVAETARAIHDDVSIPAALPHLASMETTTQAEPVTRRALNANFRLGSKEAAGRLLAFALNDGAPRTMREEALIALRLWKTPPPLDRVDGYARRFSPAPIDDVLTSKLDTLLELRDPGLKTLGIEIMIAHALKAAPEQLAAIVADAQASGELRAQTLMLMAGTRGSAAFSTALDTALAADTPAALHRVGLELLLPENPERLAREASATLETRSVPEQQHAFAMLARAAAPAADRVLVTHADALIAGSSPAPLRLDVLEALRARSTANPALAAKLQQFTTSPAAAAQSELLAGGSIAAGRDIALNHLSANCTACHVFDGGGGSEVGPNLRGIGGARDSAYLLESLLAPSNKMAPGYGIVNVTLRDKTEIAGNLAGETPETVTVRLFDGSERKIARADIASQTPPISVMPPMGGILQPREIRDLVAYLTSLKGGRARPAPESK
jgi:quinoprotein glucose dehydrogenase